VRPGLNFKTMIPTQITQDIELEIRNADQKYGHFHSTHEAYAVLQEEVNEAWTLIQGAPGDWKKESLILELTQVAAIAIRTIIELKENKIKFV